MRTLISKEQLKWVNLMEKRSNSPLSQVLLKIYRFALLRKLIFQIAVRIENGPFFSKTIRKILSDYHGVKIGLYSYGSCLVPGLLPIGTSVGAYCSFANGIRVFRRNHVLNTLSQHPFFYNKSLGLISEDTIGSNQSNPLVIGNDVWIGEGVVILPGCQYIGNGAVIGAGSVITKNIEPYTVVGGNPARIIRYRYSNNIATLLERSKWWDLPLPELLIHAETMLVSPVSEQSLREYLSRRKN